jgi:hypothetical protein
MNHDKLGFAFPSMIISPAGVILFGMHLTGCGFSRRRFRLKKNLDNILKCSYYFCLMNKNNKFINVAALVFYLFYAILPLLYTTESVIADENLFVGHAFEAPSPHADSTQGWLLVSAGQQDDHEESTGADILLRKKRAIAPSKDALEKLLPRFIAYTDLERLFTGSFVPLQTPTDVLNRPVGFSYCHSGISPPSV